MDSSIFEIIIDEFEGNCSLLDFFQDSLFHSDSSSFSDFEGPYCSATIDQIGTCWPRSIAGGLVERPCPDSFNGIRYNTTSKCL
uniref:G-protein coupled receptors family 2 profile 1 domain-containing protein n=1 Tax=Xenopus tropicalis TaxID=8364 RepID=A0A1B8Y9Z2_XENTR